MRVKNKEIRARRQRKEQKQKDAARELRAKYGDPKTNEKTAQPKKPSTAKATAAKKPAEAAKPAAKKPAAPKAKKTEAAGE